MRRLNQLYKYLAIFAIFLIILGCTQTKTVKIGFLTDLSSRNSELGIQGRSGLQMAAEELNQQGGIAGHEIELVIRDHQGNWERCVDLTEKMVDDGIQIIIGPLVSSMAEFLIQATSGSETLIISPTVSTDALTGIDDNFIRIIASASSQGAVLAGEIIDGGFHQVAIIRDSRNSSYTDAVANGFRDTLDGTDVEIMEDFTYLNLEEFPEIIEALIILELDSMVFIASGIDSSAIIQQYKKYKPLPQLYGSAWTKASRIHEYGSRTVEGMIIVGPYENAQPLPREIEFKRAYETNFNLKPNLAATHSYESLMLYARAVEVSESFDSSVIKETIYGFNSIQGIGDEYTIDESGDCIRQSTLFKIRNNQYTIMK